MENSTENRKIFAFSLIEVMVSLIVMTIIMAAFAPIMTKKASQKLESGFIRQDADCKEMFSEKCYLCDLRKKVCLGCELSCIDGKTLDYNNCVCR